MERDVIINRSAIRDARYKSKLSMFQAAEQANISQGIISRIENGINKGATSTVLYKLAKAYNVTMESLLIEID